MADNTNRDFIKMQQDAIARVRDMQRRAKIEVNKPHNNPRSDKAQQPQTRRERPKQETEKVAGVKDFHGEDKTRRPPIEVLENKNGFNIPFLKDLKIDRDVLIILIIALILMSEEADIIMLLALAYILFF